MAVPKKKISYSRTRKRFLPQKDKFTLYIPCNSCLNFLRLHRLCNCFSFKSMSLYETNKNIKGEIKLKTNINYLVKTLSKKKQISN
jgi:ribosomal protein L32